MEPKIIFEDEDLLVLDKPAGMIVNRSDTTKGEQTVADFVEEHLGLTTPAPKAFDPNFKTLDYAAQAAVDFVSRSGIVHRLDKETSGIILVAKTLEAFINLQAQFKERKVQKTYLALAHGKIEPEAGEINVTVGRLPWNRKRFGVIAEGRESVTLYKVLSILRHSGKPKAHPESDSGQDGYRTVTRQARMTDEAEALTLVELTPKTGRTHQIRVHLQYIKHPIFSDPLYAGRKTSRNDRELLPRVFLHASKISFFHPRTNELLNFESPLPEELQKFLATLVS